METIGQNLINAREKKKLSLEDVYESTRITVENLLALEEDRFNYFPNKVYARAFLRDYSNFLGLDSGELLDRYEDEWINTDETSNIKQIRTVEKKRSFGWVYALILIIVLAAGGYYAWDEYGIQIKERFQTTPANVAQEPTAPNPVGTNIAVPKPAAEPINPNTAAPAQPAKPVVVNNAVPNPVAEPQKPVSGLRLRVATLADVWVRVVADGKTAFIGTIANAKVQEFDAKERIVIRVGKPAAVQIRLNDKPQKILADPKQAATLTYTQADLQNN